MIGLFLLGLYDGDIPLNPEARFLRKIRCIGLIRVILLVQDTLLVIFVKG